VRGTGLSVVGTGSSVAKLLGSVAFGLLWTFAGLPAALACFLGAGVVALAVSAALVRRGD
jgi:hypothetical protein